MSGETSGDMADLKDLIGIVADGRTLDQSQAEAAFDIIMSGDATPAQIGAFLMALRVRGETVDEITGAARIMRAKAHGIDAPADAIDIVGTGGDAKGTLNVSTGASFVVAACGVPVAKHGNRALSSKTGAADVLTALGVNIDADFALVRESIWENNLGFLMAPRHHSAMRNVDHRPDPCCRVERRQGAHIRSDAGGRRFGARQPRRYPRWRFRTQRGGDARHARR